jgi:FkbM family methyltransferase
MGEFRNKIKNVLLASGAFPISRALYRRLSRQVQAAKEVDRTLYSLFVRSGDLVFDVGAHLGIKSEIFLEIGATVIAVEPNPLCHSTLRYMFGSNVNFTLLSCALADAEGKTVLHHASVSTAASLREDWPWLKHAVTAKAEVEVTTLDRMIEQYGVPHFCKIDVEGFESEVLRGLSRALPNISFEYHLTETGQFLTCLDHLAKFSQIKINFICINGSKFVLPEWIEPRDLDLRAVPSEGDCFAISNGR